MAHREKLAWLTLTVMIVAYAVYFGIVGPSVGFGRESLIDVIWSFGAVAVGQVIAMAIGALAVAGFSFREAFAPADERDRSIMRRGANAGYMVLLCGLIYVGVVMPFSEPAWKTINAALGFVVLAELVKYGVVLFSYRRGWHG